MTGERMRGAGRALVRHAGVISGLGFVWLVTAGATSGGLDAGQPANSAVAVMVVIAAAAAALATVSALSRILLALAAAVAGAAAAAPPGERPDLPVRITQARPDAAGKPRPRAPGRLLAVA
ncbi:MAG: hypothetical protein EPO52_01370 [Herbiconiux sp.]|uniref:DUF6412 domain-containing protein n=1 Tax=Herbiconiux sp. TaxID=1871186 RepID=UPI0011F99BED|nr:DUF6412 domain-containing protein [Herbiconiux sp.]TAJ50006.1 MAG: hypothetical protein EPO52_01370 [Herbiconiux sp.]